MSNGELSLFSYEILGLVGRSGAGPHDLHSMARRGRFLDWAGESQYYVEPKRLASLGYLEARKEPGRTGERTVYSLTEKGLAALRAWAATPARVTPLKSEPLVRLLIADLVGDEAALEGLRAIRTDIDDLLARLDEAVRSAGDLPHRRRYLLLIGAFLRRFFELHLELVDELERHASEPAGSDRAG